MSEIVSPSAFLVEEPRWPWLRMWQVSVHQPFVQVVPVWVSRSVEVKAVAEGDTVTAFARMLHKGKTLHVWNVDIKDTAGDLISNVRVTNYIIKQKKE